MLAALAGPEETARRFLPVEDLSPGALLLCLVPHVLYPVSGLVLYLGGQFDRRSRLLGAVLVLLGALWAQPVAGGLGVGLYPELFLPAVLWLFVGEFPRVRRGTRLDVLARRMALLAAVVGGVLQLANLAPVQALSPSLGVLAREVPGAYIAPAFFGPLLRAHPRGARRPSVAGRGRGARQSFADAGVRGRGRDGAGAARRRGGRGVLPGDGHGGGGELGRPPRGRPASRPGRSAGRRSGGCGGRGRWRRRPARAGPGGRRRPTGCRAGAVTVVRSASARTSACRTRTNCRMWGSRFVTVVIRDELQPSASTGSRRPQGDRRAVRPVEPGVPVWNRSRCGRARSFFDGVHWTATSALIDEASDRTGNVNCPSV